MQRKVSFVAQIVYSLYLFIIARTPVNTSYLAAICQLHREFHPNNHFHWH